MKRLGLGILFSFLASFLITPVAAGDRSKAKGDGGWTISDSFEDEDAAAEEEKEAVQSKFKEDSDDTYEDESEGKDEETDEGGEEGN